MPINEEKFQELRGSESTPRYPDVHVQLTGQDGNAFAIIARVRNTLRREVDRLAAEEFAEQALQAESYDGVLRLCMTWVDVS